MRPALSASPTPYLQRHMPDKAETLSIRNMVCDRCIRVVREELERMGLDVRHVELGTAEVSSGRTAFDIDAERL